MNKKNIILNSKNFNKRIYNKKASCLKNINKLLSKNNVENNSSKKFKEKLLSSSALSLILQANCMPKDSAHTVSRYEKLRSFCLQDGPRLSKSSLNPLDNIFGKNRNFFNNIKDDDLENATKFEYLWKNSIHILEKNKCKDLLEFIMNANIQRDIQSFTLPEGQLKNLKKGIQELKKYYKKNY